MKQTYRLHPLLVHLRRFVTYAEDSAASQVAGMKHTIGEQSVEVKRAVPREAIDPSGRGGPMRGRGGYGGYGGGGRGGYGGGGCI